jgi:hypothetical protein
VRGTHESLLQARFVNGQDPSIEPSLSDALREVGQEPDKVIARASYDEAKAACSRRRTKRVRWESSGLLRSLSEDNFLSRRPIRRCHQQSTLEVH